MSNDTLVRDTNKKVEIKASGSGPGSSMTKEERQVLIEVFKKEHGFDDADIKNLKRYEDVRRGGSMNMLGYLGQMDHTNANGGKKLADWIMVDGQYGAFMDLLKEIGY